MSLQTLITSIRACRTQAEERAIVARESASLRTSFRSTDYSPIRHVGMKKLLYFQMLGYATHFGQLETLKLIASDAFHDKRIGYLGLVALLDERSEVLMMATNAVKVDLESKNQYVVGLALEALGSLGSEGMCRDLAPALMKLFTGGSSYIKKKAALCAIRVMRKVPDHAEDFVEPAVALLQERHHGVLLAAVTLVHQLCLDAPEYIARVRQEIPLLIKILKALVLSNFSASKEKAAGISDPFLQVEILQLLAVLGRRDEAASELMGDVLAQTATNTDSSKNAGNAVLYESVKTIMSVESTGGLRVMAVNTLGKFLKSPEKNIRYVALNALVKMIETDLQAVQRHRVVILECVKESDISLRRRALALVYALVTPSNVVVLAKELIDYLLIADKLFKPELGDKICELIERLAPDAEWRIQTSLEMLVHAGSYVKERFVRSFIAFLSAETELHGYASRAFFVSLNEYVPGPKMAAEGLKLVGLWCCGEFGDLITSKDVLPGESDIHATGGQVVNLAEVLLRDFSSSVLTKEYALSALVKMSCRFPGEASRIQGIIEREKMNVSLELQQRACEYSMLLSEYAPIKDSLLEPMPPISVPGNESTTDSVSSNAGVGGSVEAPAENDLVSNLLDIGETMVEPQPNSGSAEALSDLLGDTGSANPNQPVAPATDMLADLFGAPAVDSAPVPPPPPPSQNSFLAFESDGLRIMFSCTQSPQNPAVTSITATSTNISTSMLDNYSLQVAVPKYMSLQMEPANGSLLGVGGNPSVAQTFHVNNSTGGAKALAVRLRMTFSSNGVPMPPEDAIVKDFPAL